MTQQLTPTPTSMRGAVGSKVTFLGDCFSRRFNRSRCGLSVAPHHDQQHRVTSIYAQYMLYVLYLDMCNDKEETVQRTVVAGGPRVSRSRAVTAEGAPGLGAAASVFAMVGQTPGEMRETAKSNPHRSAQLSDCRLERRNEKKKTQCFGPTFFHEIGLCRARVFNTRGHVASSSPV